MDPSLAFPAPESDDPEDVGWTLQTAGAMWGRGDHQEAVRWLRRAAEAAADAGRDERAVSLARSAADLSAALSLPRSVPPPLPSTPQPAPSVPRNFAPITPVDDIDTSADYTIPDAKPIMPPPRKRSASSGVPPVVPPPRSTPAPPAPPAPSRPASAAPGPGFRPRQTLRVAVLPAPDDKSLLHVRVLHDDEQPPEGAHEALLTALEPGAHLLSKKR